MLQHNLAGMCTCMCSYCSDCASGWCYIALWRALHFLKVFFLLIRGWADLSGLTEMNEGALSTHTHNYVGLNIAPYSFPLSLSPPSISSPLIRLPPVFPSLLISRLLMKARVQRRTERQRRERLRGRGGSERHEREEFWTNCLFVKTCPLVCLFACLLLWCESLNELPARTTTQHLLLGFPFHVPLKVNEKETERQPASVWERLITCFNNGD